MKFRNKITNEILPANLNAKWPKSIGGMAFNFKGTTHKEFCRQCLGYNFGCPDNRYGQPSRHCAL